jgi:hypothetical protein
VKYVEELKLYESGLTETQIGEKFGVKRSTVQFRLKTFRDKGILKGSHKDKSVQVDWSAVEKPPEEVQDTAPVGQQGSTPAISCTPFTEEEIEILKALAERERSRTQGKRTGETVKTSLRLDRGLLITLKQYAHDREITITEALSEAIEYFLS